MITDPVQGVDRSARDRYKENARPENKIKRSESQPKLIRQNSNWPTMCHWQWNSWISKVGGWQWKISTSGCMWKNSEPHITRDMSSGSKVTRTSSGERTNLFPVSETENDFTSVIWTMQISRRSGNISETTRIHRATITLLHWVRISVNWSQSPTTNLKATSTPPPKCLIPKQTSNYTTIQQTDCNISSAEEPLGTLSTPPPSGTTLAKSIGIIGADRNQIKDHGFNWTNF